MNNFIAVGTSSSTVSISSNGVTFTSSALPASATLVAIASDILKFVALNRNTNEVYTTLDAGVNWSVSTSLPVSADWSSLVWSGTQFCGISKNSSNVAVTSPDGITWTQQTLPASLDWLGISWNGSIFCAITENSDSIATSPDGITWTLGNSGVVTTWRSISWNGSVFCAIGTSNCITSPDGITWTSRALPSTGDWRGLAWNGTTFVTAKFGSTSAATSPDGITWTARTMSANKGWSSLGWNGSVFLALPHFDSFGATSPDGITWTNVDLVSFIFSPSAVASDFSAAPPGIIGSVPILFTPSSTLTFSGHTGFIGNSTISLSPVSLLEFIPTVPIIGSIVIDFTIVSQLNKYKFKDFLTEGLSLNSSSLQLQITNLIENISLLEIETDKNSTSDLITELFNISEQLRILFNQLVLENINITDTIYGLIYQIESLAEIVTLQATAESKVIFLNSLVNLINVIDSALFGKFAEIVDILTLPDLNISIAKSFKVVLDSFTLNSTISSSRVQLVVLSNSIDISGSTDSLALLKELLNSELVIRIPDATGQDKYLTYLFSPESSSISNYNNYNFDGCAKFGSKYLFFNKTGLYEYGGNTDNGDKIKANIVTSALSFGTSNLKQVPQVYLGVINSDNWILKVRVDGKADVTYKLNKHTNNLQTQKISIGKGLIGRYFQFELITTSDEFSMESIEFFPLSFKRKL